MKIAEFVLVAFVAIYGMIFSSCAAASTTDILPETQMQNNVTYITGGIGQDESSAMRSASRDYALEIVCVQKAIPRDEFLAAVKVRIVDAHGKVALDVVTDGPYLLANLPQGAYTITADSRGDIKTRKVRVGTGKHRKIVFVWARPST